MNKIEESSLSASITTPKQAIIHALSHDGRGVAIVDGKTTFIKGALPGETVSFLLLAKHKRYNEADVLKVIESSENRSSPLCPHFGICGGCSQQHLPHPLQIE